MGLCAYQREKSAKSIWTKNDGILYFIYFEFHADNNHELSGQFRRMLAANPVV